MRDLKLNFKRLIKKVKKLNFTSIMFLVLSLISSTFAWFAFTNIVDNDMNIDIKAWKVNISENDNLITNKIDINIDNFYPGTDVNTKTITISNDGDLSSVVSYRINYMRIFDEELDVNNQEALFDKLSQEYPFTINFDLNKTFLDTGDDADFSYSITWPLDSGDDNLDAWWGNKAYDFLNNEIIKHNQDNTYEVRDCIMIEVELIVEQFVDDGTNMIDVNYPLGTYKYLDVNNGYNTCIKGDTGCYKFYVVEKDNLNIDTTVKMMGSPVEGFSTSTYANAGSNIIDSKTVMDIISTDVLNTVIVKDNLSSRVLGTSNDETYYNNILGDMKNNNYYIKFSSAKFDMLKSGDCYWVKNDTYSNLAIKLLDYDNVILYYENNSVCKVVPVIEYTK